MKGHYELMNILYELTNNRSAFFDKDCGTYCILIFAVWQKITEDQQTVTYPFHFLLKQMANLIQAL